METRGSDDRRAPRAGEGPSVDAGVANRQSARPVEAIVSNVLEKLGYDVGFVGAIVEQTANHAFLEDEPAAEALFQEITIPLEDIIDMATRAQEGENSDREIQATAEEWIAAHRDTVDEWLAAARAAIG